ncbi:MAG TPA: hypothetical protein VFK41_08680 [Nocardioidaceae bacterium]|nr:hypothetical protein [Nocardioidaceae bacterium]
MKAFLSPRRTAAAAACAALVSVWGVGPASAAGSDVEVVNTETVQVYTSATGEVESQRIYEQLALTGTGSVDFANPVLTAGLRNLDGFGGFEVRGGEQIVKTSVDGTKNLRSVSDYKGDLPLDVDVAYSLDGEEVSPGDVVGESGSLEVRYTVKNVTGVTQPVTFKDGRGNTVTKDVLVPIPLVGQLSTGLPSTFRDVTSEAASMAGDGKGGTKLSFTMTLFPPIGSDTATFGYTAQITDGIVPRATVQVLPVDPLASPTFKTAATSYEGGASTGAELTEGASTIDTNLLKLRDGAADLLAGLIQLRDGAAELSTGLVDRAAPGARQVADGSSELSDGLGKLGAGADQLGAGADKLADGTGTAYAGAKKLTAGLDAISGGLDQLASVDAGLPAAKAGIAKLQAGLDLIVTSVGAVDQPLTLIGGLASLEGGLGQLENGSGQLLGGLQQLVGQTGLPAAKGGVDQVKAGLDAALAPAGSLNQLLGGLQSLLLDAGCQQSPVCLGTVQALITGVNTSKTDLGAASAGLGQVSGGLGTAISGIVDGLIPGATQLQGGLTQAKGGAADLKDGALQLKGGLGQVQDGLDVLAVGVAKAVAGVLQLASGSQQAATGGSDLTDGLGQLDDGAGQLADGAGRLADGAGDAYDGSQRLAAGADELASGLGDAAAGSGRLADGLKTAAGGAPQLVDGAGRLSEEGTSQIVEKGDATARQYGELYATLEKGAERAQTEKMIVGAPEDAIGLAAYSYEIAGEDGEGGRNLTRTLGGLVLLAMAGGVVFLRRRLV